MGEVNIKTENMGGTHLTSLSNTSLSAHVTSIFSQTPAYTYTLCGYTHTTIWSTLVTMTSIAPASFSFGSSLTHSSRATHTLTA